MDCSLQGSSIHGIFQARILHWFAISFSKGSSQPRDRTHVFYVSRTGRWILYHWATWNWKWKWSRSVVSDSLWPPWTVARQAPLSMGFSRQEYWSGLPFPSPGDLPNPGIESGFPALQADALSSEPPGKPTNPCTHASTVSCLKPASIPLRKHFCHH